MPIEICWDCRKTCDSIFHCFTSKLISCNKTSPFGVTNGTRSNLKTYSHWFYEILYLYMYICLNAIVTDKTTFRRENDTYLMIWSWIMIFPSPGLRLLVTLSLPVIYNIIEDYILMKQETDFWEGESVVVGTDRSGLTPWSSRSVLCWCHLTPWSTQWYEQWTWQ